ncbi:MAG: GSU2403 family nucleotidyltransferase fold protein [Acidobacteriota bacterium]
MPFDRLPETTQTLYAELLEQSIHAAAAQAAIAAPSGSFVRKHIKGRTYWYLQRLEGKHKRQHYLGPDSDTLRAWIQGIKDQHSIARDDRQRRQQLCSMLATGGAVRETAAMIQVLQILSEAGVFRWGGVLVGTQAFAALANLLGVRFDRQALRTQDIDVAQDPAIGIALAPSGDTEDVAEALTESKLGCWNIRSQTSRQLYFHRDRKEKEY